MNKLDMTIEIELGVTGGEEDEWIIQTLIVPVFTLNPKRNQACEILSSVSNRFTVAAAFAMFTGFTSQGMPNSLQ